MVNLENKEARSGKASVVKPQDNNKVRKVPIM